MDPFSKHPSDQFQASAAMENPRTLFSLMAEKGDDPRLVNFHQTEHNSGKTYRWTESVSMVRIRMAPAAVRVSIDTGCLRGESVPFPFAIYWNDYLVPRKALSIRQGVISFEIDTRFCESIGEQKLTISCKPLNAENGRRKLGMPICSIKVIETVQGSQGVSLKKYRPTSFWRNPLRLLRWDTSPSIPIWKVRIIDTHFFSSSNVIGEIQQMAGPQCDQVVVASRDNRNNTEIGKTLQELFDAHDWHQLAMILSTDSHDREPIQSKVEHLLPDHLQLSRQQIYDRVIDWFGGAPPKQAYVIPFFASDYVIAMALKDVFKTKVCVHIIEDRCLYGTSNSDEPDRDLVQEVINKCDLLFVASPEMRQAYEKQFGKIAYLFPPTVSQDSIPCRKNNFSPAENKVRDSFWSKLKCWIPQSARNVLPESLGEHGVLIGEISDRRSLERIRSTLRASGLKVDWFLENSGTIAELVSKEDLQVDGIHVKSIAWDEETVIELRKRPFAILPSGKLDGRDCEEGIARLSLPHSLLFAVAAAHLPVIALGSPQTCIARFLSRFNLGMVADYDGKELRNAALELSRPVRQETFRQNAFYIGKKFSSDGIKEWLWHSLELEQPSDQRFEELFPASAGEFDQYLDPLAPAEIHWAFKDTWQVINRIKRNGFMPDVIIDVGASTGVWSWTASRIFPDARFLLIDPLLHRYDPDSRQFYHSAIRNCEAIEVALADHCGVTEMVVSEDLYTSSLFPTGVSEVESESLDVQLMTLSELAKKRNIQGRTLLKIDVQFAQHLVLNGGLNFIRSNVDYIILELTINPTIHQARSYRQMLEMMDELGFEVIDETEGWRNPKTGVLEQKDTVFVRRGRHPLHMSESKPLMRAA